jgi:hypothetical protein
MKTRELREDDRKLLKAAKILWAEKNGPVKPNCYQLRKLKDEIRLKQQSDNGISSI